MPSQSRSGVGRRVLNFVLCVGLISAVLFVQRFIVAQDALVEPVATAGAQGSVVSSRAFEAEVTRVDVTAEIEVTSSVIGDAEKVPANGVWVVVWARVTALEDTVHGVSAELRMADGVVYDERGWFWASLDRGTFSPAIPQRGAFVFEVPADRLDGPALVLTHRPGFEDRLSSQVEIDLGEVDSEPGPEAVILTGPEIDMGGNGTGEAADASE
ncbi:hypothetical protein [Nocardiopsis sp. CC223A]|uniref:hypothetical protein n=1 Tax=Nocardiopsis sp. CC223A TaxID=3044051 RepID=UPI00278BC1F6|nr:hypothetical protein [Nocardiopsis sp. CC223A]